MHVWVLWCFIRDDKDVMEKLMKTDNQRYIFVESFIKKLEESELTRGILDATCNEGHPFRPYTKKLQ